MAVFCNDLFVGTSVDCDTRAAAVGGTPQKVGGTYTNAATIQTNGDVSSAGTGVAYLYAGAASGSSADYDVEMKVTMNVQPGANQVLGPIGRCSNAASTFYLAWVDLDRLYLIAVVNGGFDYLSTVALAINDADVWWFKLEMRGTAIKMYARLDGGSYGAAKLSVTNSAITATGFPGFYLSNSGNGHMNQLTATDTVTSATRSGASVVTPGQVTMYGGRTG